MVGSLKLAVGPRDVVIQHDGDMNTACSSDLSRFLSIEDTMSTNNDAMF